MNARNKQLTRDFLRDLVADIRMARRDPANAPKAAQYYADKQIALFRLIWPRRHSAHIDRYGAVS